MRCMKKTSQKNYNPAFSLVEVVMAIGITSFSMLVILGLLPVGLNAVQRTTVQVGETEIARQVRADLEQLPLTGTTDSIQALNGTTYYYSQQGTKLPSAAGAYFGATFAVGGPTVPGAPTSFGNSAQNVTVTLSFPQGIAASAQQHAYFSFLAAGS